MRIVYNIAGTYNSGGMERVLANKANWLVRYGYEVIIITTDQQGKKSFFELDSRIQCYDLGINYIDNNGKSFFNKLIHYPYKLYKHKKRLTDLLNILKPNIVISMFCNDVSFITKINDGSKKILEIHFSRFKRLQYGRKGLWKLADWWRYQTDAKVVNRFDKFIVLTEEDKGYWGNLSNIAVIPNARTFRVDEPANLDQSRVIAVGRLEHQKGFERLLDAWSIIVKKMPDWNLRIVGNGILHKELQTRIDKLGLSDSIFLNKTETDMISVYKDASILAMSSYYEGLPMVLLEAQAVGLPVVSFACKCGPKDVIKDGLDGFLVKEGDVMALAEKLLILMKDKELRLRMGMKAYVRSERYAEDIIMNKWQSLFNELQN